MKYLGEEMHKFNLDECNKKVIPYIIDIVGDKDVELFTHHEGYFGDETPCDLVVDDVFHESNFAGAYHMGRKHKRRRRKTAKSHELYGHGEYL
jgi:hypothetical protein